MLDQSAEAGAAVDVGNANPSSRARISAAEVRANISRGLKTEAVIARELDASLIEKVLKRVLSMVLQYDFELPQLERLRAEGVITAPELEMLQSIPREERLRETYKSYRMSVKGFKEQINQVDFQARISEAMNQLMQIPAAQEKINWSEMIEVYMDAYRMPSRRIIRQETPRDQAREENALLAQNRLIQVLPEDVHADHLLEHYNLLMTNPTETAVAHVQGHIQGSGGQFPQPPPEIAQIIGLAPPAAPPGAAPGQEAPTGPIQ
jgi:hypothetical protein